MYWFHCLFFRRGIAERKRKSLIFVLEVVLQDIGPLGPLPKKERGNERKKEEKKERIERRKKRGLRRIVAIGTRALP